MLTAVQIDEIKDRIIEAVNPIKVILFGSYANGHADDASDLDLFIILNSNLPRPQRTAKVRKALYGLVSENKDILVYTPEEVEEWKDVKHSFVNTVMTTGRVIYERS